MQAMGVDGIGSGGGRPVRDVGASEPAAVRSPEASRDPAGVRAASGPAGSVELGRLERGEIDLNRYLDARADAAVRHLEGRLPAEHVAFVRHALREQIASDPVLIELVRRTTGAVPTPTE